MGLGQPNKRSSYLLRRLIYYPESRMPNAPVFQELQFTNEPPPIAHTHTPLHQHLLIYPDQNALIRNPDLTCVDKKPDVNMLIKHLLQDIQT